MMCLLVGFISLFAKKYTKLYVLSSYVGNDMFRDPTKCWELVLGDIPTYVSSYLYPSSFPSFQDLIA